MAIQDITSTGSLPGQTGTGRPRLDRTILALLIAAAVLSLVSIFLSGLAAAIGSGLWLWQSARQRRFQLTFPPFALFLGLFVLFSVFAILASPDVGASLIYLKKFLRFVPIFILFSLLQRRHTLPILKAFYGVLAASAVWGLLEFAVFKEVDLMNRIDGFMSHWMTFSGQLMLGAVLLTALGLALFRNLTPGQRWMVAGIWILLMATLVLTLTRGAWLGAIAGVALILVLRDSRWLIAGIASLILVYLLMPASFHERLLSGFDLSDATTRGRIALVKTGLILVEMRPWTGVGPRLVWGEALAHRQEQELPDELYQHLHNNVLQVAVELGIPALLAWIAIWLRIAWDLLRLRRNQDRFTSALATGGLGVLLSFHVMGIFEYNFGDSEVFLLLFFLLILPYVAARSGGADRAGGRG